MSWDELAALHTAPLSGRADANAKDGSGAWPDEECLWLLGATFDELMRVGELNFEEKACFLARFRRCGANAAAAGFVLRRLWSCVPFLSRLAVGHRAPPLAAHEADGSAVITSSRSVGPPQDLKRREPDTRCTRT